VALQKAILLLLRIT
jgi:hypothetical protein